MPESVVIVDAFSSGSQYAGAVRAHPLFQHLDLVHVQSRAVMPEILSNPKLNDDFPTRIVHTGDPSATLAALRSHNPVAVLPGCETGVELADELATLTGTPSNGVQKSSWRRNKFEMIEGVRRAGLRTADQIATDSLPVLMDWVERRGLEKVVIKPLRSAGLDKVTVCEPGPKVAQAFSDIFGKVSKLGEVNRAVLAQSFLDGTEYFVDTVSCWGKHHATDIWRYDRKAVHGSEFMYDRGDLLRGDGPVERRLSQYVYEVLDALGIRFGPAHAEVMMTGAGPVLVEIGGRPCGAGVPTVCRTCVGYNQIELGLAAYLAPEEFRATTREPYRARQLAMGMYFISHQSGKIVAAPGLKRVEKIPGFFGMKSFVTDHLKVTVDMFTTPGIVEFVCDDEQGLDECHRRVRELEQAEDFWVVE